MNKTITIGADGQIAFIHDDDLAALVKSAGAKLVARRASHVEPVGEQWTADLSPVGGPVLGPFDRRDEALAAERAWLEERNLLCLTCQDKD